MNRKDHLTRRRLLSTGAGALAASGARLAPAQAQNGEISERFSKPSAATSSSRILVRGGAIISMDERIGDLSRGDVLIQGTKIIEIAPVIDAGDAQVIDAESAIVMPGFIDAHRHCWLGQLRLINPNSPTYDDYRNATHLSFAQAYRPEDMYVGNYLTAIGCLEAGITSVIDNCHNSRSSEHSDAAIQALQDSGIRAVHASGAPQAGNWDKQWPKDLERLQKKFFSSKNQLVTLRMFAGPNRDLWAVARKLGLMISTEFVPAMAGLLGQLASDKLLGPDNTFNHCTGLSDASWKILADNGVTVNVAPRADAQWALGTSGFQKALDHAIKPGFSVDNETAYSGDMFMEMRVAFYLQRSEAVRRAGEPDAPKPIMTRDVLYCATIGGHTAQVFLTPSDRSRPAKEADLIVIRANDLNLFPSNNAVGTAVHAADRSNVDTVIVGGRLRKYRGAIVDFDMEAMRKRTNASREYLFSTVGYWPQPFTELLPKLG